MTALMLIGSTGQAFAQSDNLLFNGDFETTDGTQSNRRSNFTLDGMNNGNWGTFDSIPGWETTAGDSIEIQRNTIVRAESGSNYVELDSYANSAMSQTLNLNAGDEYELSFYYQARTGTPNDNGIAVFADSNLESLFSNEIYSVNETRARGTTWAQHSVSFTASAEAMTISFAATGRNNSLGGLVDSISLNPVTVQVGPAPTVGGGLLGALALLGLGLLRRSRRG